MDSRHLVDPELRQLLEALPDTVLSEESVGAVREQLRALALATVALRPSGIEVTEQWIKGGDGAPDVRLVVYRPVALPKPAPAVLHIHGGGLVAGVPEMAEIANLHMALDMGCVVVSVDYRLAPETRFPGALEDCFAALIWMQANAGELGIRKDWCVTVGESAGGGLAAGLNLLARDRGVPISFQLLIYPMLDDRTCIREPHPFAGQFVWQPQKNAFGWRSALGQDPGGESVSPYAAPGRATDLRGLPPTFIAVGSLDLFIDEDLEYAQRLMRAGVSTELHVYPGAFHGFQRAVEADVSLRANSDRDHALRKHFARLRG